MDRAIVVDMMDMLSAPPPVCSLSAFVHWAPSQSLMLEMDAYEKGQGATAGKKTSRRESMLRIQDQIPSAALSEKKRGSEILTRSLLPSATEDTGGIRHRRRRGRTGTQPAQGSCGIFSKLRYGFVCL
jgi:hypothetical protein